MSITIIGSGNWGSTLAGLVNSACQVRLWCETPQLIDEARKSLKHTAGTEQRDIQVEARIEDAFSAEAAARGTDPRIGNSEGSEIGSDFVRHASASASAITILVTRPISELSEKCDCASIIKPAIKTIEVTNNAIPTLLKA